MREQWLEKSKMQFGCPSYCGQTSLRCFCQVHLSKHNKILGSKFFSSYLNQSKGILYAGRTLIPQPFLFPLFFYFRKLLFQVFYKYSHVHVSSRSCKSSRIYLIPLSSSLETFLKVE